MIIGYLADLQHNFDCWWVQGHPPATKKQRLPSVSEISIYSQ